MSVLNIPSLPENYTRDFNIDTEKAAKVLLDPAYQKVLRFFLKTPKTITELALHLDCPVSNAYYYVKTLRQLAVLNLHAEKKRTGKPIKQFICSADSYFIPLDITPAVSLRELLSAGEIALVEQLERSIESYVYKREGWGVRLFRDDAGNLHTAFTPKENWRDWSWFEQDFSPSEPAIFAVAVPLQLSHENAKELQKDLAAVFQKYYIEGLQAEASRDSNAKQASHLMRLELAPVLRQ